MAEVLLPWENLSSAIQNTHVISAKHSVMGSYLEPTILSKYVRQWCFAGGSDGKESACNAGDTGGSGLIPRSGKSPEEEMATHCSILPWRIPWTEEPGGLWFMGSQRVISQSDHDQKSSYHSLPCT